MGQRLSPVIKLTESCNLACHYCYQEGQLSPGRWMSLATLETICNQLALCCRGPLPVLWYGGEPTLVGLAAFKEAIDCAQHHLGHLQLQHSLQTNGLLIDSAWASFLGQHNFSVRVSLDGPEDLHNQGRPRQGGGGSHARVIKALEYLKQQNLCVRTVCTVTRPSLKRARELVNYFASLGLEEIDFSPALRLGPDQDKNHAWIDGKQYGQFLIEALDAWFELPQPALQIRSLAALIRKLMGHAPGYCKLEGSCSRYLTFGWDGSVYPCDEFFRQVCLGNIHQQPLEQILRQRPPEPPPAPDCQACQWEASCPGSLCPFERAMNGGDSRASILCDGWRMILEHCQQKLPGSV